MRRRAILLNGPSSSGKSTLARAICNAGGGAYSLVSIDDFLEMRADEAIWEDDVYAVSPMICAAALTALAEGRGVVVDHVITSERIYQQLMEALTGVDVLKVHVTCSREALIRREQARGNRCPGSAEASFDHLFPRDGYDLTVDTTERAAKEIAGDILAWM